MLKMVKWRLQKKIDEHQKITCSRSILSFLTPLIVLLFCCSIFRIFSVFAIYFLWYDLFGCLHRKAFIFFLCNFFLYFCFSFLCCLCLDFWTFFVAFMEQTSQYSSVALFRISFSPSKLVPIWVMIFQYRFKKKWKA